MMLWNFISASGFRSARYGLGYTMTFDNESGGNKVAVCVLVMVIVGVGVLVGDMLGVADGVKVNVIEGVAVFVGV